MSYFIAVIHIKFEREKREEVLTSVLGMAGRKSKTKSVGTGIYRKMKFIKPQVN